MLSSLIIRKAVLCYAFMLFITFSYAQGCIAVRSGCGANVGGSGLLTKGSLQVGTNFRYFHSYKHFRGTHEETYRVKEGSEVINDSFFADLIFNYGLSDRLSAVVIVPFVHHRRSSMYEHGGNPRIDDPSTTQNEFWSGDRHTTVSQGLSDIRFGISYWVFNPVKHHKTNFTLGLGLKLASGNFRAEDEFYNAGPNKEQIITSGVDQSIQPGDGGVGVSFDMNGYHSLTDQILLTANLFYLVNPREKYSLEARGSLREYSVPDQYAARLGAMFMLPIHGLFFYTGGRIEGIPSSDLIGGDDGFRRPGYIVSVEPGMSYTVRRLSANVSVPIAVERNRVQSYTDKVATKETGVFRQGDAAFADYLINVGFTWNFSATSRSYQWQDPEN